MNKLNKAMRNEELRKKLSKLCDNFYDHSDNYKNQPKIDAEEAADYYFLRKPLSAVHGGSTTIAPIVKTKVDDAAVQIMDILSKLKEGTSVESLDYTNPISEAMACKISAFIDRALWTRMGHKTLRAAVKDSLICGTSALRWYVEEEPVYVINNAEGLDKLEVEIMRANLMKNQELDIVKEQIVEGLDKDSELGNVIYDVRITTTNTNKVVKYKNITFNDLHVDPNAHSIEDANYVCIKSITSKAELLENGYNKKLVEQATSEMDVEYQVQVNTGVEMLPQYRLVGDLHPDRNMEEVILKEHYVKTTLIDNKLRLYRVVKVGNVILDITPERTIPVVEIIPIPNISCFWGASFAYQLRAQQDGETAVMRGYIDNIHNANHGRMTAVKGQYNKRDLMDNRPRGVVEIDVPNAIQPFPYNPLPMGIDNLIGHIEKTADDISGISQEMLGRGENSWATNLSATQVNLTHSKGDLTIKDYAQGIIFGIQALAKGLYSEWRMVIGPDEEGNEMPSISDFKMVVETESGRRSKAADSIQTYQALAQTPFMTPQLQFALIKDYLINVSKADLTKYLKAPEQVMQEMSQPNPAQQLQQGLMQAQVENLNAQTKLTMQKADIEADTAASEQDREDAKLKFEMQRMGIEMSLKDRAQTNEEFKTAIDAEIAQKTMQTNNLVAAYEMTYRDTFAGGELADNLK